MKSWKTTIAGLAMLGLAAFQIYANPKIVQTAEGQGAILALVTGAAGLIAANDHKEN